MPSVAVIGASSDRSKFGNKAVRAYAHQKWTVYPVHPSLKSIEGLPAYASIRQVPAPVDRITIYLPPEAGMGVLPDIAAIAHTELFLNPGAESHSLLERARQLGLHPVQTCAILEIGESPSRY